MRLMPCLLGLALGVPAGAETAFNLISTSETAAYAVLVVAPETGCVASRVVIRGDGGVWKSATLGAGEIAVVRIGRGLAAGEHRLRATTAGCPVDVTLARRVVLGKQSPDHGWRGRALN